MKWHHLFRGKLLNFDSEGGTLDVIANILRCKSLLQSVKNVEHENVVKFVSLVDSTRHCLIFCHFTSSHITCDELKEREGGEGRGFSHSLPASLPYTL